MQKNLKTLVGLFAPDARRTMEAAAVIASHHGHYEVTNCHFIQAAMQDHPQFIEQLSLRSGLKAVELYDEVTRRISVMPTGNEQGVVLSDTLIEMMQRAWFHASAHWQQSTLSLSSFWHLWLSGEELPGQELLDLTPWLQGDHAAAVEWLRAQNQGVAPTAIDNAAKGALESYGQNVTELARQGRLDPVTGREAEIRQMIDVLLRRRQNNPLLVGEPGVGKTALVEGVAQKIVGGEVPDALKACEIYSVDLCKLQAGASVKGEFEKRLQNLLNDASQQPHPVILFIDEAHMLLGAGGTAGQNDAANQLKPALSRSEFQVIGATTWAEYKAVFEKDAALARRFQLLRVAAPDENTAIAILRQAAPLLEKHHSVTILHEAVEAAVHLSERYMTDRQLPDKCLSLLDTACARVSLSQQYTPLVLEKAGAEVAQLQIHHAWLEREGRSRRKLGQLKRLHAEAEAHHLFLKNVWQSQKEQVLAEVPVGERAALSATGEAGDDGQSPMVFARVDATCVADVISEWTGIPLGQVLSARANDEDSLLSALTSSVVGQPDALTALASKIFIARAGLHAPDKPVGVFMLAGPSGTGKTETALTLASVYGVGQESLITINMSEYQEAHTVSSLKGAPPGYVGYGKGGVLTEAVRKNPHSVVLLDEIEKAHPDVLEMLYQVLDKGWLKDAEGITINFRNTLIVMTSNYASDQITQLNTQGVTDGETLISTLRPLFDGHFKPAFMGRVQLLAYQPLTQASLLKIAQMKLDKIAQRVALNREGHFKLVIKPTALKAIVNACVVAQSGARDIDAMLETLILPGIARILQQHNKQQGAITVSFSKKTFNFIWEAEEVTDDV